MTKPRNQTDLAADEVQVRHGGGLILLTAVQARGQCELAVRNSRLQTTTPEQHRDIADVMIQRNVGLL